MLSDVTCWLCCVGSLVASSRPCEGVSEIIGISDELASSFVSPDIGSAVVLSNTLAVVIRRLSTSGTCSTVSSFVVLSITNALSIFCSTSFSFNANGSELKLLDSGCSRGWPVS
uniref:Putative secreted protein n=1 Tax=Anopheles darlingi TaxID=43151 RepID=A0A2M4D5T9_ANODA